MMRVRAGWTVAVTALCLSIAPAIAQAAGNVAMRVGEHDGYSRVVFDFETVPAYEAAITGETLEVRFPTARTVDLSVLEKDPLAYIAHPQAVLSDDGTVLRFQVPQDSLLRHFLNGQSVVIDVMTSSDAGEGAVRAGQSGAVAAADAPEDPRLQEKKRDLTATRDETIPISLNMGDAGLELAFGWQQDTAAASFVRAEWLWVVFDRKGQFNIDPLRHAILAGRAGDILAVETLIEQTYSVVRLRLRGSPGVAMTRSGPVWRINLTAHDVIPREGLIPERREGADGAVIFVTAQDVGARIHLTDPDVGDNLTVIPLGGSGRGLAESRQYVNMDLLQSAQGLAVRPLSDDLEVVRFQNGFSLGAKSGLALSESRLGKRFQGMAAQSGPQRLLNPEAWRLGDRDFYTENEQAMLADLSLAGPAERKTLRWDLARFYAAHGAAAEAHAMLTLLADTDPAIIDEPSWRAVSGLALLGLNRPKEALRAFMSPSLDAEADIWLWRALAAQRAGRVSDALSWYQRGKEALVLHDDAFLVRLHLAMAEAAFTADALDIASVHITALENMGLSGTDALATDYLSGRLSDIQGDFATARARYQDAATAKDRALSTRARFALIRLEKHEGELSVEEAIERLERLRFAWRGDDLELNILETLAGLYEEDGQYRKALEALQFAAMAFTDTPQARKIAARMSQIFAGLFLDGGSQAFSPLEALGLFYDFSELTPLGADGDRMIRNLVDRLVSVDLLDRAADLLEHQVSFRLEGAAQASVAAKLGKIFLLDGKPEEALRILRSTRQTVLPDDVMQDRILVSARALTELKRYEEAIVLLEDVQSSEADALRADIYWGDTNWPSLAVVAERILGDRHKSEEPLGLKEREILIRYALALSFMDDRESLAQMRERYQPLISTGDYAGIFDLLTSPEGAPEGELSRIAGSLGGVDQFRSFLSAYRAEFVPGTASAGTGGTL